MTAIRIILGLIAMVVIALFFYGLKKLFFYMGQDFAVGAGFGAAFMFCIFWLHFKVTGKDIFTADS